MNIREIMTRHPRTCTADSLVQHAAHLMLDEDVGQIPVIDAQSRVVGVITDRDIVLRCIAVGIDALETNVAACMTSPALTLRDDATLEECAHLMAREQIRRVPIVDADGVICGIVAQADIEATDAPSLKAQVAERVSVPH